MKNKRYLRQMNTQLASEIKTVAPQQEFTPAETTISTPQSTFSNIRNVLGNFFKNNAD